jgi:hypothetical protein
MPERASPMAPVDFGSIQVDIKLIIRTIPITLGCASRPVLVAAHQVQNNLI